MYMRSAFDRMHGGTAAVVILPSFAFLLPSLLLPPFFPSQAFPGLKTNHVHNFSTPNDAEQRADQYACDDHIAIHVALPHGWAEEGS